MAVCVTENLRNYERLELETQHSAGFFDELLGLIVVEWDQCLPFLG